MAYSFSDDTIEKVRFNNNIVEVISQYVDLKKTGSNYVGLCPFHNEKTPSFTVSPDKQLFHCFGCNAGGDVISFVMKIDNMNFPEAIKKLADRAGILIDDEEDRKNNKLLNLKNKLYEINRVAGLYYYNNLVNDKVALGYLLNRGLSIKTIKHFGLGYAKDSWDDLYLYLKGQDFAEEDIEKVGLIIKKKKSDDYYNRFRNRIMFPIIDNRKRVIGFGGRGLNGAKPKYLNTPDTVIFSKGKNLFGLNDIKRNIEKLVLVEGYMDVISLYNNDIRYSVASLGTALTTEQAKLLSRYTKKIYICYDADDAGINAANKAIEIFKDQNVKARVILLPKGKDPDDYIKEKGREEFERLFDSALNYIDFKIFMFRNKYDIHTVEGKVNFTRSIASFLREINSPIEIDAYINRISEETGISKEAIKAEVNNKNYNAKNKPLSKDKYINNNYRYNKNKIIPIENILEPAHLMAEKSLLRIIIEDKSLYKMVKYKFKPDDFCNNQYKKLAQFIYEKYENGIEIDKNSIIENFKHDKTIDEKDILDILELDLNIPKEYMTQAVDDYIDTINFSKLNIRRKEVLREIKLIETKTNKAEEDVKKLEELCLKLSEIDEKIKAYS